MKTDEQKINGLNFRHVSQIVRRKMMSKVHNKETQYNRRDKSWKKELL